MTPSTSPVPTTLSVLDLFSGIGGFSLGLERAKHNGKKFKTVAFCEIEDFPRKVLAKHWPEVPCYGDVRTLTAEQLVLDGIGTIDVITGGFPCQDISTAGKQAGIAEGTRSGLWSEIVRLVGELRPQYVIVENVANLLRGPSERPGAWFGRVLGDLAECGYDAEWENIPASAVGAPHRRERVWIVAYPDETQWEGRGLSIGIQSEYTNSSHPCWGKDKPGVERTLDGVPNWVDRVGACGNAIVPQIPQLIGQAILETLP